MTADPDRWIRWTTIGCVALLVLIAGTAPTFICTWAGGIARAARLGCRPGAAVGGQGDRRCGDHAPGPILDRDAKVEHHRAHFWSRAGRRGTVPGSVVRHVPGS